jgi:putative sigma-54 modulation protein
MLFPRHCPGCTPASRTAFCLRDSAAAWNKPAGFNVSFGICRPKRTGILKAFQRPPGWRRTAMAVLAEQNNAANDWKRSDRMNILLTGQHVDITPPIRDYVEKKLERVTRHFDQIIDVAVVLGVEQPSEKSKRQRAEVNLRVKGQVFHMDQYHEDLYAAIDLLIDKLDRQVVRYKDKIQEHRNEPIKQISSGM